SSPMVLDSFKKNIVFLKGAPQMPISSTEIRTLLQSQPSEINLNPNVLSYIKSHYLYHSPKY
ncbi:MAG: hypothetical protein K2I08_10440, partial [Muribaculaceae bacterium]|nr:hypothetical protein [Muribaculaceae bacterium]